MQLIGRSDNFARHPTSAQIKNKYFFPEIKQFKSP